MHLRRFCDLLEARGQRDYLSTYAPMLGRSLCALGRHDEAEPLAQLGRELGRRAGRLRADALAAGAGARPRAAAANTPRPSTSPARPSRSLERTDALNMQGDALCDLAEVLHAAGRSDEAAAALAQALERYERKKNLAMAAQVRDRLAELQDAASR